jgi:hypothetical protein
VRFQRQLHSLDSRQWLRLEDIGANVLWGLMALVPLINIALAFYLFFAPRDYTQTKKPDPTMKLARIPFIVIPSSRSHLTAARPRYADGSFRTEQRFLPMNLLWSHTGVVFADGIAPQMDQHCDLRIVFPLAASDPAINRPARIPPGKTCLQLETEVRPFTGSSHLEPGAYRLSLRIAAS